MRNKKALVTITIGEKYQHMFNTMCREGWAKYCERHGYDLIVIDAPLDLSERAQKRSPAWQKLLILSQNWSQNYEQLVWVDSDVLINYHIAPAICQNVPVSKVGAVDEYGIPTTELFTLGLHRLYRWYESQGYDYINNIDAKSYYSNRGFDNFVNFSEIKVVQTGVFVCSPKFHRALFESVYYNYEDFHGAEFNYEMPALSYNLVSKNQVYWISNRFNFCVQNVTAVFYPEQLMKDQISDISLSLTERILRKFKILKDSKPSSLPHRYLQTIYECSFFMHFASCTQLMSFVDQSYSEGSR